ncbi:hypothetical protein FGIG_06778 [Fasciola gigantica]|uniref:Uncharacterized protein n=1 Tax=Fasciola gigantica TaxID=46835 RepID=A0A504YC06_FASGI|nr:hypothetical protein FGIG_06778 [Fasciola gigantica]
MAVRLSLLFFVTINVVGLIVYSAPRNDENEWRPHVNWNFSQGPEPRVSTKRLTRSKEFDAVSNVDIRQAEMPPLILDSSSTSDHQASICSKMTHLTSVCPFMNRSVKAYSMHILVSLIQLELAVRR